MAYHYTSNLNVCTMKDIGLLRHYTDSPIEGCLKTVTEQNITAKPNGFWISVDDGWKDWCEAEGFALERLEIVYEVELVSEPNIKLISSALELDCFHEKYKDTDYPEYTFMDNHINWNHVSQKYKGIIIAPYIWERRLYGDAHNWYYGWDCASGCIWDMTAIKTINQLEETK